MFIEIVKEKTKHIRKSKLGKTHEYERKKSVVILRCDSCGEVFKRDRGDMASSRLNNNYFHCCCTCDPKRFAQRKGAERKIIWNKSVNSDEDISKL